jgi:hypothetical protein
VRTLGVTDEATKRRRLYGFLARRGHDGAAIRRVMDRVLGEAAGERVDAEWEGDVAADE